MVGRSHLSQNNDEDPWILSHRKSDTCGLPSTIFQEPKGDCSWASPPPEHCVVETLGARVWWHLAESESPQHLCGAGSVTLVSGGNRLREGEKLPGITSWLYRSGDGALVG